MAPDAVARLYCYHHVALHSSVYINMYLYRYTELDVWFCQRCVSLHAGISEYMYRYVDTWI